MANNKQFTQYRIVQKGTWEYLQYLKPFRFLGINLFNYWSCVPDFNGKNLSLRSDNNISDKHWDGIERPKLHDFHILYPNINDWFLVYEKMLLTHVFAIKKCSK